ncbi:MAG: hypothetical protein OEZ06_32205 [Myxococcales bacterium]|nr:hypothetical protein [Myxococcales bacterium]
MLPAIHLAQATWWAKARAVRRGPLFAYLGDAAQRERRTSTKENPMKRIATAATALSPVLGIAMQASATWVSDAKVTGVRTWARSDQIDIGFNRNVTSG